MRVSANVRCDHPIYVSQCAVRPVAEIVVVFSWQGRLHGQVGKR